MEVGVSAFLLNACQSYRQGEALIHRGSRGGIVTLSDVANSPATQLGRIIARLMNSGFNLRTALHVAKRELITGQQYIVVGDGGTTICQSRSGAAAIVDLEENQNSREINITAFPNGPYGVGSLTMPSIGKDPLNYYIPGEMRLGVVTEKEISDLLSLEVLPVFCNSELTWSDDLSFRDRGSS